MSCCQYVPLQQLALLIDRLRNASLSDDERAEHERFFRKCIASPDALAFILDPEQHPANPHPGKIPSPDDMARIVIAMR